VSACVGKQDVMQAWGDPSGEALHTGTFFGHPVGCAAALASLSVIDDEHLIDVAAKNGAAFLSALKSSLSGLECVRDVRGVGMLIGVELDSGSRVLRVVRKMLERGHLLLPAGGAAEVISISPPVNVHADRMHEFQVALADTLRAS